MCFRKCNDLPLPKPPMSPPTRSIRPPTGHSTSHSTGTQESCSEIGDLRRKVKDLEKLVAVLSKKIDEVYYSPGLPGALAAKADFKRNL